ncbi:IS110 family transposase [Streptomyces cadmiisoli]|uniref:IS110 family transposase n=1 Tax=Streptomyces cadmiisoli TaxID=2184053 RepID=A0A2Z4JA28_9ACTN|nr:IS110 family transposase [Streptomyces cadmiisoli]AWW35405.1 IS110 family transposase [Streptomyces cadmiisoli]AWW42034.1 IS110 family transposase [Streptomyces cadmiisoli]
MASIPPVSRTVIGGVDTHKDLHVAAVIDTDDHVLGTEAFSTTRAGYRAMLRWMRTFGDVRRIGIEGTGSYGAGLLRHLQLAGIEILEVNRPDRSDRRRRGKDDTLDAENAAHAALAGHRTITPKTRDGMVESLRVLRVARSTAVKARRVALQMLRCQIISAPEELRDQVRNLTRMQLIRTCAAWRPDETAFRDPTSATRIAIKSLARRYLELNDEVADLDSMIEPLVHELAPTLLERTGFGIENTAQLLVTCGDNPERVTDEARFAKLCGVAPLPASSGKVQRHRLNRGGDRQANSAIHMAVVCRLHYDENTKKYVERRTNEGKSKMEIIRCLKRYVAREAYYAIKQDSTPNRTVQRG